MSGAAPGSGAGRIQLLDDRLINQIAAGEVVERPASVVKELVENALDAGARHLKIVLKGGGRDLVQVEDDGHGMGRQDATLCVERHATSKIRSSEDLGRIHTLGFRGEALPSIAAVSHFELLTRREADAAGTRVVMDGGRMVDVREAGCPVGTQISVRSLFFNLPARRKFLRSEETELEHCQNVAIQQVLIRPQVGLDLFHEGRPLLRVPALGEQGGADPAERALALLGRSAEGLVALAFDDPSCEGLQVSGLVSPLGTHSASARASLWLFVNGRAVRDPLLRRAVTDAFRGIVPQGRFPTAILDLRLPVDQVDVNVHPAKAEVRFSDPRSLSRALIEGLRAALAEQGMPARVLDPPRRAWPPPSQVAATRPADQVALPGLGHQPPELPPQAPPPEAPAPEARPRWEPTPRWEPPPARVSEDPAPWAPPPPAPGPQDLRLVGQAGALLVCASGPDLVLVDLARAGAQVLLRRLRDEPRPRPLLTPVLVELLPAQVAAVEAARQELAILGVELEGFGGDTVRLMALPAALAASRPEHLVRGLARALEQGLRGEPLLRTLASLAAPALGTPLSAYEQKGLLAELDLDEAGLCLRLPAAEIAARLGRA